MSTAQDLARRQAIAAYDVVGRPPEDDLQGLVELAAAVCDVSAAAINIIDDRHQHQVAAVGMEASVCSRQDSMCAQVFQGGQRVVVPDARVDDRFARNPFVTGLIGKVRFYASSPLVTPSGIPIGTLCVFDDDARDLSEPAARSLELLAAQVVDVLELRRTHRELTRSNEQLARFAGQVSHDLGNPLAALRGFLELASSSPELADAPFATMALSRAELAADRMNALVVDLLEYARVGGKARRTAVDLGAVVAAVVEDLDAQLAESGATVHVGELPEVTGDETLLRALLQNLLANAVKFTAASGVAPVVSVACDEISDGWRVAVDDNGPGVEPQDRERVFGLMERASSTVDGVGIGLSTCRRIVEAHGGLMGIDESGSGGASVWFTLPG
ncbi:ATP-binding protein [Pedococcus sp. NPDC057267]|uniref:sensor histidine kinase n=1 Tax=Pedococcus sp. NPDC057267 TaxID=3346077 RepID=UPI003639A5BB